jgi:hypothetical protein
MSSICSYSEGIGVAVLDSSREEIEIKYGNSDIVNQRFEPSKAQ